MKVKNNSKHSYCHSELDKDFKLQILVLKPNEVKEIPDGVAKSWIKAGEIVEYIEPQDAKKLENENKALKKELEKLKENKKSTKSKKTSKTKN